MTDEFPRRCRVVRRERMAYQEAWRWQLELVEAIRQGRDPDHLLLLEHDPVYTLGRSARADEVWVGADSPIPVVRSDRGGRVTYHGPGQMVAYVLRDLRPRAMAVREHVERLESTVLTVLEGLGVAAWSDPHAPGVWTAAGKIAALGVRIREGVAYHGVAINREMDLTPYGGINPCGLAERGVTSLARLGVDLSRVALEEAFMEAFSRIFHVVLESDERACRCPTAGDLKPRI